MPDTETLLCILVRCGGCRRMVYAAVNRPKVVDRKAKNLIGKMIAEGCTVEHVTADIVRKSDLGCECTK